MEKKYIVLETYKQIKETINQIKEIKELINIDDYSDNIIDEYMMFASIYLNYNFKDNGCPFYDINRMLGYLNNFKIVQFKPNYSLFLQDLYDLLFEWIFNYRIKSTRIRIMKINIKININYIQFEILNNKTIQDLINLIAEYYNLKTVNLKIKKNNLNLDETKKILEFRIDETSRLSLNFNQFS